MDMDIHGYPWIWISMDIHRKSVDMDMDMDVKFHIHGNPALSIPLLLFLPFSCLYLTPFLPLSFPPLLFPAISERSLCVLEIALYLNTVYTSLHDILRGILFHCMLSLRFVDGLIKAGLHLLLPSHHLISHLNPSLSLSFLPLSLSSLHPFPPPKFKIWDMWSSCRLRGDSTTLTISIF